MWVRIKHRRMLTKVLSVVSLGIITACEVLSSFYLTTFYIMRDTSPYDKKLYMIGSKRDRQMIWSFSLSDAQVQLPINDNVIDLCAKSKI